MRKKSAICWRQRALSSSDARKIPILEQAYAAVGKLNHSLNIGFTCEPIAANILAMRALVPKSVAQLTGVLVTAIVAFGTDLDVYYAMPLGVFAGALAIFFVSLSEERAEARAPQRS